MRCKHSTLLVQILNAANDDVLRFLHRRAADNAFQQVHTIQYYTRDMPVEHALLRQSSADAVGKRHVYLSSRPSHVSFQQLLGVDGAGEISRLEGRGRRGRRGRGRSIAGTRLSLGFRHLHNGKRRLVQWVLVEPIPGVARRGGGLKYSLHTLWF